MLTIDAETVIPMKIISIERENFESKRYAIITPRLVPVNKWHDAVFREKLTLDVHCSIRFSGLLRCRLALTGTS